MLQWSVIALLGLAVLMVNSAQMEPAGGTPMLQQLLIGRPTLYAGLAISVMLLVSRLDPMRLYRARGVANPIPWMLLVAVALSAVALVPGVGATINGSSRWLHLGPRQFGLTFQPSELAKWAMVLAVAWWCGRRSGAMHRFRAGFAPAVLLIGLVCGLIVVEDFGTAALIGTVALVLLVAGGVRWWQAGLLLPVGLAGAAAMIVTSPYRVQRLTTFLDPYADPQGAGYQPIQMMAAIAFGQRGIGNGIAKQGYLPADSTDAILAVICEEIGFAGAAMVIALYLVILWVGLGVLKRCRWPFGRLVTLGVLLTIGLQAAMNIAVVTVTVPTKGIALPLLSSGGTGWVLCAAAIGLVVAIDRSANEAEVEPDLVRRRLSGNRLRDADHQPAAEARPA
jgi:cell division protein FtsW